VPSGSACPEAATSDERVLVLAPVGRDAPLLCQVLERTGLAGVTCGDMAELARHLREGVGVVLLTEEALAPAALSDLIEVMSAEPPWSDLPMVLLASGEPLASDSAQAIAALRSAGNLTVLERPVRGLTLITAVQAALRARRRQYEVRDLVQSEQEARQDAEMAWGAAEAAAQAKDEFLAIVSHELRTPLSAILLWIRILGRRRLDEKETARALQAIERSAEAQSQLIEDLLDVSRMTSGKLYLNLQAANLEPLVRAAIDVVRPAADAKHIQIEAALERQAGVVEADPGRIQQVVCNLLNNAVKFTPPGGRILIGLWRADGHVCIEVADTGKGISPQFLPHVFERFQQADPTAQWRQGGLGLGLTISRQLVELHCGTIRAASPGEGLGAVFTVELPLAPGAGAESVGTGCPRGSDLAFARQSLVGVRVLLVEDDTDTREAMAYTLRQYGIEVTTVESAGEALDVLSAGARCSRPHVLLSDLGMPGMDGYELLHRIRAMEGARGDPALPAAVITAYARKDDHRRSLEAGFAAHISKPIEPEQLIRVVAQLARRDG
jgi:signal transduction histidine kinase/CheY-like chemotaxis protein